MSLYPEAAAPVTNDWPTQPPAPVYTEASFGSKPVVPPFPQLLPWP